MLILRTKKTHFRSNKWCVLAFSAMLGGLAACGALDRMEDGNTTRSATLNIALRPAASTGLGEPGAIALDRKSMTDGKFPLVLMYHDVIPGAPAADDVTPQMFTAQMNWLKKNSYKTITMDQYVAYKSGKLMKTQLPAKPVLITFDDGYKGVLNYAKDELVKNNFSATLFVHTGFVGSSVGRAKMSWSDYDVLEALVDAKGDALVRTYSHTVTHPVAPNGLASLTLAELQKELVQSKKDLETKLSIKVPRHYIAWPQGNYDTQVVEQANLAGYVAAFAVGAPLARVNAKGVTRPLMYQYGRLGIGKSITSVDIFSSRIQDWMK